MNTNFTKILVFVIVTLVASKIRAQQDPHYSQFMFNKLTFNPAFAGATDGKICATLIHRTQWTGFSSASTQSPDFKGLYQGDAPTNDLVSLNIALTANQGSFLSRIGMGITISKDQLGFENTVMPKFSLAYRQPIGTNGNVLAAGVGIGLMQKGLLGSKLKALDPDDPKIPSSDVKGTAPDIDAGLYYTMPALGRNINNFYIGASTTHVNQSKITYEWANKGSSTINNQMHYYLVTGAEIQTVLPSLVLQPNVLIKKDPAKIQADINCYAIWNSAMRGGLSWRPMDAVVLLVGYELPVKGGSLNLGYSYDLTTSKILKYSTGSHEIMLRYCFGISIPTKPKLFRPIYTPRFM